MTSEMFPLSVPAAIHHNDGEVALFEQVVRRGEGQIASSGALVFETGVHTGRSPRDKFTVRDETTEDTVWWDNNRSITTEQFDTLYADFIEHARSREMFVQDLFAGADPSFRLSTRVFCEYAWHALFIRYLLRRPQPGELEGFAPEFTVVNLPSFRADPARHGVRSETVIACNFKRRIVLIGGSSYAGETKKSVFSYLNYIMPSRGVMPMHCSANVGASG
ncbi:MAG: phosphoenolpyruvate carboxykinase (ATP), partial [Hyphomicrobiaceae bacterium]|nr:phosphoenolpyruvate carboxykinase (ATP) [Hyphomicrobiaceae bacterium]